MYEDRTDEKPQRQHSSEAFGDRDGKIHKAQVGSCFQHCQAGVHFGKVSTSRNHTNNYINSHSDKVDD